jgi:hypothetical protein
MVKWEIAWVRGLSIVLGGRKIRRMVRREEKMLDYTVGI